MIDLKDICMDYGMGEAKTRVLDHINLHIEQGEITAIMGPSGSGKTTLLNILGAMDVPTEGTYQFKDCEVSQYGSKQLNEFRKNNIAFVFQKFELIQGYTVRENVELPMRAKNIKKKERKETAEALLDQLGIGHLKKKFPGHISGGEQQRCAIARAMASDNDLILADEPTGSLDQTTGQDIMKLLKEMNQKGKTILVVTHDEHIANMTDRIIRLEDGRIVSDDRL